MAMLKFPAALQQIVPTSLAGVDMYMAPDSWKGLYESLLSQVNDGTVPWPGSTRRWFAF